MTPVTIMDGMGLCNIMVCALNVMLCEIDQNGSYHHPTEEIRAEL